jgi:hypothetical protein
VGPTQNPAQATQPGSQPSFFPDDIGQSFEVRTRASRNPNNNQPLPQQSSGSSRWPSPGPVPLEAFHTAISRQCEVSDFTTPKVPACGFKRQAGRQTGYSASFSCEGRSVVITNHDAIASLRVFQTVADLLCPERFRGILLPSHPTTGWLVQAGTGRQLTTHHSPGA